MEMETPGPKFSFHTNQKAKLFIEHGFHESDFNQKFVIFFPE